MGAPQDPPVSEDALTSDTAVCAPVEGAFAFGSREVTHEELFHFHRWRGDRGESPPSKWNSPRLLRSRDSSAVALARQRLRQLASKFAGISLSAAERNSFQREVCAVAAESSAGDFWGDSLLSPSKGVFSDSLSADISSSKQPRLVDRLNFRVYVLPLRAGEWLRISGAVWMKVLRGLVEVRGHIFPPSSAYHLLCGEALPCRVDGDRLIGVGADLRVTALPPSSVFKSEDPAALVRSMQCDAESRVNSNAESALQVLKSFVLDSTHAALPSAAFLDVFSFAQSLGCLSAFASTDADSSLKGASMKLPSEAAPAAVRLLAVDSRMSEESLCSSELEKLLGAIDAEEFPVVVCFAPVRAGKERLPITEVLSRTSLFAKSASKAQEEDACRRSSVSLALPLPLSLQPPVWFYAVSEIVKTLLRLCARQRACDCADRGGGRSLEYRSSSCCHCKSSMPAVVVWGPKQSGKSSFVAFLINFALNVFPEVCLLECDVGQPMLTAPESAALLSIRYPLLGPPDVLVGSATVRAPSSPSSSSFSISSPSSSSAETRRAELPKQPASPSVQTPPVIVETDAAPSAAETDDCELVLTKEAKTPQPEVIVLDNALQNTQTVVVEEETSVKDPPPSKRDPPLQKEGNLFRAARNSVLRKIFFASVDPQSDECRYVRFLYTCIDAYEAYCRDGRVSPLQEKPEMELIEAGGSSSGLLETHADSTVRWSGELSAAADESNGDVLQTARLGGGWSSGSGRTVEVEEIQDKSVLTARSDDSTKNSTLRQNRVQRQGLGDDSSVEAFVAPSADRAHPSCCCCRRAVPLVVNAAGWDVGLGMRILSMLLRKTRSCACVVLNTDHEASQLQKALQEIGVETQESNLMQAETDDFLQTSSNKRPCRAAPGVDVDDALDVETGGGACKAKESQSRSSAAPIASDDHWSFDIRTVYKQLFPKVFDHLLLESNFNACSCISPSEMNAEPAKSEIGSLSHLIHLSSEAAKDCTSPQVEFFGQRQPCVQKLQLFSLPSFSLLKEVAYSRGLEALKWASPYFAEDLAALQCQAECSSSKSALERAAISKNNMEVALFSPPTESVQYSSPLAERLAKIQQVTCCVAIEEEGEGDTLASEREMRKEARGPCLEEGKPHRRSAVLPLEFRRLSVFFSLFGAEILPNNNRRLLRWRRLAALFFPEARLALSSLFIRVETTKSHLRLEIRKWRELGRLCPPLYRVWLTCHCGLCTDSLSLAPVLKKTLPEASSEGRFWTAPNGFSWERLLLPSKQKMWRFVSRSLEDSRVEETPVPLDDCFRCTDIGRSLLVAFNLKRVQFALSNVSSDWLTSEVFALNVLHSLPETFVAVAWDPLFKANSASERNVETAGAPSSRDRLSWVLSKERDFSCLEGGCSGEGAKCQGREERQSLLVREEKEESDRESRLCVCMRCARRQPLPALRLTENSERLWTIGFGVLKKVDFLTDEVCLSLLKSTLARTDSGRRPFFHLFPLSTKRHVRRVRPTQVVCVLPPGTPKRVVEKCNTLVVGRSQWSPTPNAVAAEAGASSQGLPLNRLDNGASNKLWALQPILSSREPDASGGCSLNRRQNGTFQKITQGAVDSFCAVSSQLPSLDSCSSTPLTLYRGSSQMNRLRNEDGIPFSAADSHASWNKRPSTRRNLRRHAARIRADGSHARNE